MEGVSPLLVGGVGGDRRGEVAGRLEDGLLREGRGGERE